MGQEIPHTHFSAHDFSTFEKRLREETALLAQTLHSGHFGESCCMGGLELESWLLDHNYFPNPNNEAYLARLNNPLVVPELSKFNVELNSTPQQLRGDGLTRMEAELTATWQHCLEAAHEIESALIMIGILPTIQESELTLANMSPLNRYFALNTQVLQSRNDQPIKIDIEGAEHLQTLHQDVMLEAATTSFQLHLQVPETEAVRYYNASVLLSAPMLAACANSPFLFEKSLWDETRIPLFEQAVDSGTTKKRVTFGSGYLQESIMECFAENLDNYPILLPMHFDTDITEFSHLRLHNGTIWRWNRPLIGFDANGTPHIRIEHRVVPAGPSIVDQMANAAFYFGLAHFLAKLNIPPENTLPFVTARENFYSAARHGLSAKITWLDNTVTDTRTLLLEELIPMARHGLKLLDVDEDDRKRYLDIISTRVKTGQNGAAWQRAFIDKHGRDFFKLTAAYLAHQRSGLPVHEWNLD
ncbi:glutamate--cysteine ligase [Sulfurirhabdus autotrophica]|uniref:Gamma-glutamyl:cysteine ligase YbdK (ATP-grasp superfamily) n=1 Tax=Sulfurirhabdus autotrophica TaxID=1706046 RepID=A0A4R3XT39_9PROT|nr:glutamate--cysteine ligase [Sulfurirhabdus autotrophica]TCV82346.1 hypothetical protein EDC63_12238 [Sulfurirhabdus autotrophica]